MPPPQQSTFSSSSPTSRASCPSFQSPSISTLNRNQEQELNITTERHKNSSSNTSIQVSLFIRASTLRALPAETAPKTMKNTFKKTSRKKMTETLKMMTTRMMKRSTMEGDKRTNKRYQMQDPWCAQCMTPWSRSMCQDSRSG